MQAATISAGSSPEAQTTSLPAETIGVRQVFALAWPIMLSMLSLTAMGLVDTLLVGRLGDAQLAAVGLMLPVTHLLLALPMGLARAIQVVTAQAIGAGRRARADRLGWQAVWIALGLGVPLWAASLAAGPLFGWLAGDTAGSAGVAAEAAAGFHLRVLAAPAVLLSAGLGAWFQGRGDTRTTMRTTLLANGLNIGLDLLLIPRMGIAGAGLAFALAQAAGALVMARRAWPELRRLERSPEADLLRAVATIGGPNGVNHILNVGAFVLFASLVGRAGAAGLAAHVLVLRLTSVSFLPGFAIGEAAGVMVGQAVGAQDSGRARAAMLSALRLGVGIMAGWAVLFIGAPDLLLAPFSPSAEVAEVARALLLIAAAFQIFDAVAMIGHGVLDGAGDARFLLLSEVLLAWFVKLPLGWLLAGWLGLGAAGAWLGLTLEIVLAALVLGWRIRSGRWMRRAVV